MINTISYVRTSYLKILFFGFLLGIGLVGCKNGKDSSQKTPELIDRKQSENPIQVGFAESDDSQIEYFIQGKGDPIVLLPGGALSTAYLKPLADNLSAAGFKTIRINPRGAGESRGPAEGVSMHTMAQDVILVLNSLGLTKVDIAGHAFGNRVARTVEHDAPEYIRSVICLAAGGVVKPSDQAAKALNTVFDPDATEEEIVQAMDYMVGDPANAASSWSFVKASRFPAAAAVVSNASNTPESSWAIPSGQNPFLVIQGTKDQVAPAENAALLKKELGDLVQVVSIKEGGHLMVINHAEETTQAILDFLDARFK